MEYIVLQILLFLHSVGEFVCQGYRFAPHKFCQTSLSIVRRCKT